jgi:hypothetical protein
MSRFVKLGGLLLVVIGVNAMLAAFALAQASSVTARVTPTPQPTVPVFEVSGVVADANGPISGATVRIQATENAVTTGAAGTFTLTNIVGTQPVTVTAWARGYTIGWAAVNPGADPITITLNAHYLADNPEYDWFEQDGVEGSAACGVCHTSYEEWQQDAHSQSAVNYRFLTMYAGTDIHGAKSPPVAKNNLGVPLPPDLSKPYYGPGFKLDFPSSAGSCATCHTPAASKMSNARNCGWSGCHSDVTSTNAYQILDPGVSPMDLKGDAAEGISCEFCHKVSEVFLKRDTKLPYPDIPGILSMKLLRPQEGHDLFFGPLDDIARSDVETPRDVYSPLMKESAFCAGCHYGILGGVIVGNMDVRGGVLVYSSYEEWLNSPWSDPETGKTCQDCHMPPVEGAEYFVHPERGGVRRPSDQIHNHRMLGAGDEEFLRSALTLTATATVTGKQLAVAISVANENTGHHVPTDSPLRHVMLVVEARDSNGNLLALQEGPVLPDWAGDYAGQPGRAFAKVLEDEWTGESPTGAIWRPVRIVEDTRLAAFATDASQYVFAAPAEAATVEVRLIYRRAYQQLMEWKAWPDPDILMVEQTLTVKIEG